MEVKKFGIGLPVATALVGTSYYIVMRNRLSGSALRAQLIAFGGVGVFQFANASFGKRRLPYWFHHLSPFALMGLGSYYGRVPLKKAIVSSLVLGLCQWFFGPQKLAARFTHQLEEMKNAPFDSAWIEKGSAMLSDSRITLGLKLGLEELIATKIARSKARPHLLRGMIQEIKDKLIPHMTSMECKMFVWVGISQPGGEEYFTEVRELAEQFMEAEDSKILPAYVIHFLFTGGEKYLDDQRLRSELFKYKFNATQTSDWPQVVRALCKINRSDLAIEFTLPRYGCAQPYYYHTLAAYHDATGEELNLETFKVLIDKSPNPTDNDTICEVLDEIRSKTLLDHVLPLLKSMNNNSSKSAAFHRLEDRFVVAHPYLVDEWRFVVEGHRRF